MLKTEHAVTMGMLLNELITNSFKYVFNKTVKNNILIKMYEVRENCFELIYSDGDFKYEISNKTKSLGLSLIAFFAKKLNGIINYKYQDSQYNFVLRFNID